MEGKKADGALVVLRVPELLSSASVLIALITGRSFLLHPCPCLCVYVAEAAFGLLLYSVVVSHAKEQNLFSLAFQDKTLFIPREIAAAVAIDKDIF